MKVTQGRKVVICDGHPQMRGGLRNVLVGMLGCEVVGEVAKGEDAIALLEAHHLDMVVLEVSLPGAVNGRGVLGEIRRLCPAAKVFVYTAFLNREDFEAWIDDPDGPDGIDEKGTGDMELAIGFTQVLMTEQKYVPLRLIRKFGRDARGKAADRLTEKERQVLRLAVRAELDTRTIAEQLNYTSSTVRSYLTIIYDKLGLEHHSRAALIAFYYEHRSEVLL